MDIENLTIEEIKKGYRFDNETKTYICNVCDKRYDIGEVFKINDRFFEAHRAIEIHVETSHGDRFSNLLNLESKYNNLTQNQKELFKYIHSGLSDRDISNILKISPSTVRNQRFVFREKAKQAKLYLAIYEESTTHNTMTEDKIIGIHNGATMVDDRYIVTEREKEKIINNSFSSLSPLKLITFSGKQKKKLVILSKIAENFDKGKTYSEKEVNEILVSIYNDFAEIRRYLIEYGFMDRTVNGSEYWLK